ncbi:HAD family hydrolase [Paraglaciecola sp. 2405UD69-4]|uniref:HAD family hydrolase n=1 Tax=Paraglaciecola sp. 2405UD69-4 TaxID=3391836 RepID=UPI0039C9989C
MTNLNGTTRYKNIELVIFDCDGVLIDSEVLSKRVLLKMLGELGADVSGEYFDLHFLGHSFAHVTAKVLADFSVSLPEEFKDDYHQALMETFTAELTTTPELQALLSQLSLPSCVATSSSPERVKHALKVTGLTESFTDCVFTCSEVKRGKPAPDIFLHAAQKMGVKPQHCLVIEDSAAGIKAAQAAQMQVIKYLGGSHFNNQETVNSNITDDVVTIQQWKQLYKLAPSLTLGK